MIELQNISYDEYIRRYGDHRVILVGAGGTLRYFLQIHRDKYFLLNNIEYILDNNIELEGHAVQILNKYISIKYLPNFCIKSNSEKHVVFILVSDKHICDVADQLDKIQAFDQIPCIYGIGTFRWGYSYFPTPKYKINVDVTKPGIEKIPRIIHYCWFGNGEIPKTDVRCLESQRKHHTSYKIMRWDEENFDISSAPKYVRDAYRAKKYAFVSDYVRLYAVYKYGGIYLDTDVELFTDLDFILKYRMMFAYMEYGELATGLGFASVPESQELKEMMEMYENIPFIYDDGQMNLTPCPRYTNEYFRRKGLVLDNSLDVVDDILFLPSDYLCPLNPVECKDGSYQLALLSLTDNSVGIHWCNNSWKNCDENNIFDEEKKERSDINTRLLTDWVRRRGF